eukprot:gene26474-biopygen16589
MLAPQAARCFLPCWWGRRFSDRSSVHLLMNSCHEGIRDRNQARIETADPASRGISSFDSSSIPVANTLLVT